MNKWFKALQIGFQILAAVEAVQTGQPATLEVDWKGKLYKLVLSQTRYQS